MAVTSWTSEGMDWMTTVGKPLFPYAEALRLAAVERCTVSGEGVPAVLQAALDADSPPTYAWGSAYDTLMTNLIGWFANHTIGGGDFTGRSMGPPYWTEAALLLDIGDPARLSVVEAGPFSAAWAKPQYALLNRLRWTVVFEEHGGTGLNHYLDLWRTARGWKNASDPVWATAVAAFAGLGWTAGLAPVDHGMSHYASFNSAGAFYEIQREKSTFTYPGSGHHVTLNRNYDGYLRYRLNSAYTGTHTRVFDNGDIVIGEDEIYRHATGGPVVDHSWATTISDVATNSCAQPGVDVQRGWAVDYAATVLKWDVAGGYGFYV